MTASLQSEVSLVCQAGTIPGFEFSAREIFRDARHG